jgi:hypothetical protein
MEVLEWLQLASASASNDYLLGNVLFLIYITVSVTIKRSRYLLAFFFSEFMVSFFVFDQLQEYQIYLTCFIVYSYVSCYAHTLKVKYACGIMCLLDLILMYDALKYGINGTHGELETVIYQSIEYLAFSAHLIIISALLPFGRIYDSACDLFSNAFRVKSNSSYIPFFWYNIHKVQSTKQKL